MHVTISSWLKSLKGTLCRSPELFLCSSLLSRTPALLASPGSSSDSSTQGTAWVPSSCTAAQSFLDAVSWGKSGCHLIWFSFLRGQCFSLSDAQCLKNCCFLYFVQFLHCFVQEGKPGPCSSILTGSRSLKIDFGRIDCYFKREMEMVVWGYFF